MTGFCRIYCGSNYIGKTEENEGGITLKQAMKKQMKSILAWVLAIAMTFANVDVVSAAVVVESVEDAVVEDVSVNDVTGSAISGGDVSEGDVTNGDVSQGDITGGDAFETAPVMDTALAANVLYSGEMNGIIWQITDDGVLTIGGEDTSEAALNDDMPWLEYRNSITKVVITAKNVKDTYKWFYSCANITEIDLSEFETSSVTDMSYMFSLCSSLTGLDLSGFDTSNVTNMSHMIWGCSSLSSLDITGFDTDRKSVV